MRHLTLTLACFPVVGGLMAVSAEAQPGAYIHRDVPYVASPQPRQKLDIFSPSEAKGLPVVFWIHGGGWQGGDKSEMNHKPLAFTQRGFVFVSTNYRMLPEVDMETITRDVAKAAGWVHAHIAEYGGDPDRMLIMGHSAGAELAALLCTDERYLKAEGVSLASVKGCVPVDGDTYDVPRIIEVAAIRRKLLGQPDPKPGQGHYDKFGSDPRKHRDFSAVNHVSRGKHIPPFLLLHVADHVDTTDQALCMRNALLAKGLPVETFGAENTNHVKLDEDLGLPGDPATNALYAFMAEALK